VAIAAGGVAAPAGLIKYFFIKGFKFRGGKAWLHACTLTGGSIVQRFRIGSGNLFMTYSTGFQVIRWFDDKPRVSSFLCIRFVIAPMTKNAAQQKVRIFPDQFGVDQIALVIFIRLNWRRWPRSPFAFSPNEGRFDQFFHFTVAGMTIKALIFTLSGFFGRRRRQRIYAQILVATLAIIPGEGLLPVMTAKTIFFCEVLTKSYPV
jgi:hypothetical protein